MNERAVVSNVTDTAESTMKKAHRGIGATRRRAASMTRAIALVALPVGMAACTRGSAEDIHVDEPLSVRVVEVVEADVAAPVVATGTLGPKDEIALSFKVGGVIADIAVDEGAIVRAGQTLARLDTREVDAAVTRARSAAEKAERDLARAKRLYADSVVTLVQFQDAETAAEVARADLDAATFNRRYAVIVAPDAGVILRRKASPGELTTSGTEVLALGSRARGSVLRVGLSDRDVYRIRSGDSATVRFDAIPGATYAGIVTEIGASAQAETGTYAVEVTLRGAGDLAAGLVGRVDIAPSSATRAPVVPIEALLEADGPSATVFVLAADGAHAERRRVSLGPLLGDRVAVVSGLDAGARVVTDGAAYLDDGVRVTVVR
jgi:RND family efflux transporter MFP subunit